MKALYLDSSAFVKVVVTEPHSSALRAFLTRHRGVRRVSSALLRTEALRAARHLQADALTGIRDALRRVDLIALDDRILEAAGVLDPAILRTLVAIHLATALALGDDLGSVVTYDARMLAGAQLLGLATATPQ